MQTHFCINLHNSLVSVFLCTLEYYWEIMFFTTNCAKNFDNAIQSRISVTLCYEFLCVNTRKTIWKQFLERTATDKDLTEYTFKNFNWLTEKEVNDQQIYHSFKNMCIELADHYF